MSNDIENHGEKEIERDIENGDDHAPHTPAISVSQAEAEFAELCKEITSRSRASRRKSEHNRPHPPDDDKTSSPLDEEEAFNLESILRNGLHYVGEKHIGVYWDGLTVKGTGGTHVTYIKSFMATFLQFFGVNALARLIQRQPQSTILGECSGVCKPGEMVLILGKPGSGCTTWLKAIANQRSTFSAVDGEVLYGPFAPAEFDKRFRGEVVFNDEMDTHIASLTVEQTLSFALDVRLPSQLPPGFPSRKDFKAHVVTALLRMFNIEHTRHTVVGDDLLRGISGGEKRRLSIAEMMVTRASVLAWDNSTRGLDSATALDFVKSARVLTNIYRTSSFITLYQASENMFREFDKVLVLNEGRQVYFGPASEARGYFASLGFQPHSRQTTPDFLTACTDKFERVYAQGMGPHNAPHDAETLARAFRDSEAGASLVRESRQYRESLHHPEETPKHAEFKATVKQSKRASRSIYSVGFHLQVWALMKRQFLRKIQDVPALAILYGRCIIIGLIFGSLYYNLPLTSGAAFIRSSVCFMLVVFNAFSTYPDLSATLSGRPILGKHKSFALYRPSALWTAMVLVDQLFSAVSTLTICIIVYFMTGFVRTAAAFFVFFLFTLAANMSFQLMFKLTGALSRDSQRGFFFVNVILSLLLLAAGYHVQYESIPWWIRWIHWGDTLAMGFMGTMQNELGRINLTCSDESLIPSGPGYTDINSQVCTLRGSRGGTTLVRGSDYIEQTFNIHPGNMWRNFGIIIAVIAFLFIVSLIVGELLDFETSSRSSRIYQKPNAERKALNQALEERKRQRETGGLEPSKDEELVASESILTWERLCYDVPVRGGKKRLLHDIYGYVRPGKLTALMGASGAGKTTLLDVLARRKNVGVISGDGILIDGLLLPKNFQRSTSYAEQQDIHEETQTIREALRFSADLRQPRETPRAEKYAYVEEVIGLLEMEDIADCVIGKLELGLTIEQRKRVTIGVELCAKPELLLFLDEPTSGLDSQGAFNIVRYLQKLASKGQAILCTIHQPNSALFAGFDRLLLLQMPGRTVYFGPIGEDGAVLRAYFARHGAMARPDENIAEFMLEAIGAGTKGRTGNRDWADIWEESPEAAAVKDEIKLLQRERQAAIAEGARTMGVKSDKGGSSEREYATTFWTQLRIVSRRMFISYYRDESYVFMKILNHVVIALINAGVFVQLGRSRMDLQYTLFVSFQVNVLIFLLLSGCETIYHNKRAIFFREDASKMYSPIVFVLGVMLAELPYALLSTALFFPPIYYMPFQHDTERAGYYFLMLLAMELFGITMGFALSSITPNSFITEQLNPFILVTTSQMSGVTVPPPAIPTFWKSWLYPINPMAYNTEGLTVNMLHDREVICEPHEFNSFRPPANSTCGEYMFDFFEAGKPGYIEDPSSTELCNYCAFSVGQEYYEPFGFKVENKWKDLGFMYMFCGTNVLILILGISFLNFNKR